mgnify:CR=1 FL=1
MSQMEKIAALIVAAGGGTRMGGAVDDKVLARLGGLPVFSRSARSCAAAESSVSPPLGAAFDRNSGAH